MYQKDYILRMIAMLMKFIGEVLGLILLHEHNYTNGHLEVLAELFNAEAELDLVQGGRKECLEYSKKALMLFQFIDNEQKTYSAERLNKIESIRKRIEVLNFKS